MKLPINKQWWQFWLPRYADIDASIVENAITPKRLDSILKGEQLQGRVVKSFSPPAYDPKHVTRKGGKVLKIMPRQLKKIKEAQEIHDL
jgi:hypothetical protein